jgi:hypothetical protein
LFIFHFANLLLLAIDPKTAKQLPNLQTNNQIYACFLLPLLFFLGFSINLVVWSRSRINYKLIFELDTKDHLNHHQFPEVKKKGTRNISYIYPLVTF